MGIIFTDIDIRGYPGSPLKTKGIFRDKSVRFKDISFADFRPGL